MAWYEMATGFSWYVYIIAYLIGLIPVACAARMYLGPNAADTDKEGAMWYVFLWPASVSFSAAIFAIILALSPLIFMVWLVHRIISWEDNVVPQPVVGLPIVGIPQPNEVPDCQNFVT